MDKLNGLRAFVKTADFGSFVAAARALEISASAVGKGVARLEADVGVRLLQRSTRRIELTRDGRQFYERCRRILDDLDDAEASLSRAGQAPRGRLRVSAPIVGHHFLLPVVPGFLSSFPGVELDLDFTDRTVDLIKDGIDVAIRSGDLPDSRLVSRPLCTFRLLLCASPAYLSRRGTPSVPSDLERHATIRFRHPDTGKLLDWPMLPATAEADIRPRTVLACNNMEAVLGAALRGVGIACMPDFLAGESLADSRLVEVLGAETCVSGEFKAIWPSSRHLSSKVRAFVDHFSEQLAARHPVDAPGPAARR